MLPSKSAAAALNRTGLPPKAWDEWTQPEWLNWMNGSRATPNCLQ